MATPQTGHDLTAGALSIGSSTSKGGLSLETFWTEAALPGSPRSRTNCKMAEEKILRFAENQIVLIEYDARRRPVSNEFSAADQRFLLVLFSPCRPLASALTYGTGPSANKNVGLMTREWCPCRDFHRFWSRTLTRSPIINCLTRRFCSPSRRPST
jgi:hypothetical protein